MHQQIRGFNTRNVVPARLSGLASRETRTRRIRGFDAKGVLLFTLPACTSTKESARTALDHRAIRGKLEQIGARLVRCEVDAIAGGHANLVIRSDGSIRDAYLVEGTLVCM